MTFLEVNFVVVDSIVALKLYKSIFDIELIEATQFPKGKNEAIFSIYGTQFHILDENPEFQLLAPNHDSLNSSIWFNVVVPGIIKLHDAAIKAGCSEIQAVTQNEDFGLSNSMFLDPFGYMWLIHQIDKEISFDERENMLKNTQKPN